ncbi:nicotinamide riboside transporter PnuC [Flagellimonas allohymeniacidonis]|uniref:Nicotinamide riboside transporter PnuC n=1 Tax=Flagellimonas allohymeniacidonis TaxID=2517819 RepID=A0A4Q8QDU1_9FLAO|nr:nicotinamide riboside transporter PnuC [Allomuricauda hymeniacidonis]TAI47894.1 nicotinamide riboside transporter PnuC [Allomuricauda hymeniacidonis]
MSHIFDWIFSQYDGVSTHIVVLELVSVVFVLLSVWYSKRENILVYPTGIVATGIAAYILLYWGLLGDMLINVYYFIMSVVGWYLWTRKVDETHFIPITTTTQNEKKWSIFIFLGTLVFVTVVYLLADKFNTWTAYVDTFTTGIFFVGMWLMAKKKLENWIYWIVGDIITVPLYWYKGLIFSSLLYAALTIIAIYGYKAWKKSLGKSPQTLLK